MTDEQRKRFETKFQCSVGDSCWNWLAGADSRGYGVFSLRRKATAAHRISYSLYVGKIPDGKCVLHRCDNPRCINPKHLWIGTKKENNADRAMKGRNAKNVIYPNRKGANNARSKLTEKQVIEIRNSNLKIVDCAAIYGVTHSCISAIRKRRIWTHIN